MIMSNHNPHHHHIIKPNSNRQPSLINSSSLLPKGNKNVSQGTFVAALTNNNSTSDEASTSLYTQVKGNPEITSSKASNINMQSSGIQSDINSTPLVSNNNNNNTIVIPTKLYVTNFPFTCSQRQIQDLFSRYGQVVECTLKKDYYAYIQYTNTRSAQSAFKNANGLRMLGRKLTVHLATSKKSQSHLNHPNGIVNALASNLTDGITVSSPNHTTNLISSSQAAIVLNNINNTKIVHIRNFPESCSQQQIRDCFKAYGEIVECLILHDSYAFVHFKFVDDARVALQSTNNMSFMQHNLLVQYSRSKFKQQNPQTSHTQNFQKNDSFFNENTNSAPNINKLIDNLCLNDSSQSSGESKNHNASSDTQSIPTPQENNKIPKLIEKSNMNLNGASGRKNSLDKNLTNGDKQPSNETTEYDLESDRHTDFNGYQSNGYIGYHNNENYDEMASNDYSDDERRSQYGSQYFNQYNQSIDHYRKPFTNTSYMNQDAEYESPPVRTKLYVTNFPEDMDQEEMKQLFNNYGNVLECTIMWNQYAFVHFGSYQEAEKALLAIKGVQYKGCKISVQWSTSAKYQQPKQHNNLTIGSKISYSQAIPNQNIMHGQHTSATNLIQAYSPKKSTVPTKILERPTCLNNMAFSTEDNKSRIFSKEINIDSKIDSSSAWTKETFLNSKNVENSGSTENRKSTLPVQSWASIMNKTQSNDSKEIQVSKKAPDTSKICQFKMSFSDIVRSSATASNENIPVYSCNLTANNKIQLPIQAKSEKMNYANHNKQIQVKPNNTADINEGCDLKENTKLVNVLKENCSQIKVEKINLPIEQLKTNEGFTGDCKNDSKEEASKTQNSHVEKSSEASFNNHEVIIVEKEPKEATKTLYSACEASKTENLVETNDFNYFLNSQDEKPSETLPKNLVPASLQNNTDDTIGNPTFISKIQIQQSQNQQQHDTQGYSQYQQPNSGSYPNNHTNICNNDTSGTNIKYPDYYNNKKNTGIVLAPGIQTDISNHTYSQQSIPPYQHNNLTNQILNQQQQLFIQNCQQQYQNGQFPMPNNLIYNQQLQQLQGLNHHNSQSTSFTVPVQLGQNFFNQNNHNSNNNNNTNFMNSQNVPMANHVGNQFVSSNISQNNQQTTLINNAQGNLWNHPMDNFNSNSIYSPSVATFIKKPTDADLINNNVNSISSRGFTQGLHQSKYQQNLMSYTNQMNQENSYYSGAYNQPEKAHNTNEYTNLHRGNTKCNNLKSPSFTYNQNNPDEDLEFLKKSESIKINNENDRLTRNCISSSSNSSTPTQVNSTDGGASTSTSTSIDSSIISIKPPLQTSLSSALSPTSELIIPQTNGVKPTEEKSKVPINSIEMASSGSSDSSSSASSSKSTSFTNSNLFSAFNYSNYVLFPSEAYDLSSKQEHLVHHQQIQQHQNTNYFQIEDVLANLMR